MSSNRGFYRKEQQIQLTRTETPTGLISNPLDLITQPQPWLLPATKPKEESKEPKVLLFADAFYTLRDRFKNEMETKYPEPYSRSQTEWYSSASRIRRALKQKQTEGFRILMLTPSGKIEEWDEDAIPEDYTLNVKEYNNETIKKLALEQCKITDENLAMLDYIGINSLLYNRSNYIYFEHFTDEPERFKEFLQSNQLHQCDIEFKSEEHAEKFIEFAKICSVKSINGLKLTQHTYGDFYKRPTKFTSKIIFSILDVLGDIENFDAYFYGKLDDPFAIIKKLAEKSPLKLKSLHINTNDDPEILRFIFKNFPSLENFQQGTFGIKEIEAIKELKPNSLPNLKRISFYGLDNDAVAALLKAAPNLERLHYQSEADAVFKNLTSNSLPSIIDFDAHATNDPEMLVKVIQAAPNLKKMSFLSSANLTAAFLQLPPGKLSALEEIERFNDKVSVEGFKALFKAAPKLKKMDLRHNARESFTEFAPHLTPSSLEQLTNVGRLHLTTEGLCAFAAAAPNIEKLDIWGQELKTAPKELIATMPKVQSLDLLLGENSNAQAFAYLLYALPNAKHIKIEGGVTLTSSLQMLPNNALSQLKSIEISHLRLTIETLPELLKRAPNLEEINLNFGLWQGFDISGLFTALPADSLKNIKKISGKFRCKKEALDALRKAAPNAAITKDAETIYEYSSNYSQGAAKDSGLGTGPGTGDGQGSNATEDKPPLEDLLSQEKEKQKLDEKKLADDKQSGPQALADAIKKQSKEPSIAEIKQLLEAINTANAKSNLPPITTFAPVYTKPTLSFKIDASSAPALQFTEFFPNVNPREYRLRHWDFYLDAPLNYVTQYIKPNDFKTVKLEKRNYTRNPNFVCHAGVKPVTKGEGLDITLPSLDPEEKIFNVKLVNAQGKIIKEFNEVDWSEKSRFNRVHLPYAGDFTIHFQVAIPQKKNTLPSNIQDLQKRYQEHTLKDVELADEVKTIRQFAKVISDNKTGTCSHRAMAAYADLLALGYKKSDIVINENDVHAKIEIKIENEWHTLELGGSVAHLNKLNPLVFQLKPLVKASVPAIQIIEKPLADILKEKKSPVLIQAASNTDVREFLDKLQIEEKNIYVAHRPSDLSLATKTMSENGKIVNENLRFKTWLENCKQGVIYIDIREFNASEVAQLNDLLDRKIENYQIPEGISIKLLDKPGREYGLDFRRRVPFKSTISAANPILLPAYRHDDESKEKPIEIDLFNSPFWQRSLMGTWGLQAASEGFSFAWKKGELLNLLLDKSKNLKQIIFKNPPLFDENFKTFMGELQSLRRVEWADQTTIVPPDIQFYQSNGYDWKELSKNVTIEQFTSESRPLLLSESTILNFLQDYCKADKDTGKQNVVPSLFEYYKGKVLDVTCAYGLSAETLAQFLTEAKKYSLKINFVTPSLKNIVDPLAHIANQKELKTEGAESKSVYRPKNVIWEIHKDPEYLAKLYAANNAVTHFDLTSLQSSDLDQHVTLSAQAQKQFAETGKLVMHSYLSDIVKKLQNGENVVLSGTISPILYPQLTMLSKGLIDGQPFKGNLIIIASLKDAEIATSFIGDKITPKSASGQERLQLIHYYYPHVTSMNNVPETFAATEKRVLQEALNNQCKSFSIEEDSKQSDEAKADIIDNNRLHNVAEALKINPWVMLPGPTGIGKSHFLERVLPKNYDSYVDFKEWLELKPKGKDAVLIVDEASFASQLTGESENFLERFKALKNKPPGFLWKGKYYSLTDKHKVVFAFNPASYGAGRSTTGFLNDQALTVSFQALPDFYIRARLITPLLKKLLINKNIDMQFIMNPLIMIYRWISTRAKSDEVFITPRHVKTMVNLIVSEINEKNITDPQVLTRLAAEVGYMIGRQALADEVVHLDSFDDAFSDFQPVLTRQKIPPEYKPEQHEAYSMIRNVLRARKLLSQEHTDLGLGGILLEGESGIGKSFFVNQVVEEYLRELKQNESKLQEPQQAESKQEIFRISPTTPYNEKIKILTQAFDQGALVIADEMNTSLWPNKLLNNYLMGLDEKGKPAKKPGFMLIGTQNPPSFSGRSEEDPALRQRLIKLKLDWPMVDKSQLAAIKDVGIFSKSDTPADNAEIPAATQQPKQ